MSCLYSCREGEVEDTLPASCVLSSQIPGYDGGEVDTNETVEVMFPINVCKEMHVITSYCLLLLYGLSACTCTVDIITCKVYGLKVIHGYIWTYSYCTLDYGFQKPF